MKFSIEDLKELFHNKDKIGDWVVKYKRQIAAGCILVCLIIVAAVSLGGKAGKEEKTAKTAKTDVAGALDAVANEEQETPAEETNALEKDAYPEVDAIIQQYFDCMAEGDMEGLSAVVDEISEEEKNRILNSKNIVEGYENISCYTQKGMEEGAYLVFVYYELKFVRIETLAPGLTPVYVYTKDDGNLCISNGEASDELKAYVEEMAQQEDVLALREEVKTKYEEAKAADEELAKQEERYKRIASEGTEAAEEVTEDSPEETAEAPEEETPAEAEETPAETGEATAQNRETRFTESVRLRAEPSTEAENLGTAYPGEHVIQIESYSDGWSKINYNGKECYCKTEFLE